MTSLFGRAEDASVQEGFICPVCLQSCISVFQLQTHVETAHDRRVLRTHFKQLFGKAKKFIKLGTDSDRLNVSFHSSQEHLETQTREPYPGSDPLQWENNGLGQDRSHWDYFLTQRSQKIDKVVVETNNLLLRLDKLVNQGPLWSEQSKRKAFEKNIVPWEEDSSVKYCCYCSDKFSLTTRKHHCRLCGRILCNKCSYYMTKKYSACILNPTTENLAESEKDPTDSDLEQALRICKTCYTSMEKHKTKVKEDTSKPMLLQLYEKITEVMVMVRGQIPIYNDVVESLQHAGESYSREDAEVQRAKILKLFDMIDSLSKRILRLTPTDRPTNSATTDAIHRRIRAYVVTFLQDSSLELKPLPSEEELKQLKAEKKAEILRKREEERKAIAIRDEKPKGSPTRRVEPTRDVPNISRNKKVGHGWTPSTIDPASVTALTDDPLLQQINIISGYMDQAQASRRWDEANALEANLKELQLALKEREQKKNEEVAGFYE